MDQDNTKGQDKRNWRERLGIGAQAQAPVKPQSPAAKDLPKISDGYRKEAPAAPARPVASATRPAPSRATPTAPRAPAAPVRPAPMAPRANPKPPAPVAPDKLAERLRSQRDASTKMAEQRVQVAKQRNEPVAPPSPPPLAPMPVNVSPSAPKPKFAFAEDGEAKVTPPAPQRPTLAPHGFPPLPQTAQPQLTPARPPLGGPGPNGIPGFQSRPQPSPYQTQQPQQTGFPGALPSGFPPPYGQQPVPPYRPIDPASGYAPPPGYIPQQPQRGFAVPPPQGGYVPPSGPRLNVPARPPMQPEFNAGSNPMPGSFTAPTRSTRPPLRGPAPGPEPEYEDETYAEVPSPRLAARPSSTDYQQAYREAEYGFEDEAPRSKAPWILASLIVMAIGLALGGAWAYTKYVKPAMLGQGNNQQIPAVNPPETPAKAQAEQPAAVQPNAVATPTKKQIYDRIVGDKEIVGGEVSATPETPLAVPDPVAPAAGAAPPAAQPAGGEEAAPLPIPPPPAGAGDQQGSLAPATPTEPDQTINPAAGESQAAVAAQSPTEIAPPSQVADAPVSDAAPPAPGELETSTSSLKPTADEPSSEKITDAVETPVVKPRKVVEKKKLQPTKEKTVSNLGSKPVVLVPPVKQAKAAPRKQTPSTIVTEEAADNSGGLFGDGAPDTAQAPVVQDPAPAKKRRTLADLFTRNSDTPNNNPPVDVAAAEPVVPAKPLQTKKIATPTPAEPVQQASTGGDFIVQLASFRSRAEATSEFARLKSKNGSLGRFSPIISEAEVGGSTRFRLSVGRMDSKAQADAVCSSLFASGERDCLVKRR